MSGRQGLPARLPELRIARKMSQDKVAAAITVSKSLISAFESGKLIPQEDTAKDLDKLYGTGDEIQEKAEHVRKDLRPWLRPWTEHERQAGLLRCWEPMLIPGLLQREAYMRELFAGTYPDARQIEEFVSTRLERQSAVLDRKPPRAALLPDRRIRASARISRDLERTARLSGRRWPPAKCADPGSAGQAGTPCRPGWAYLAGHPSDGRRVGYLDDQLRGRVVTVSGDLTELELFWEIIDAVALSVDQSRELILRLLDEYK